jgi:membrane-bound serine protease (ClpP class)
MTPVLWAILLLVLALALFALELFIPSGGLLGFLSAAALVGSLVYMVRGQGWLAGFVYLAALAVLGPMVVVAALKYWPYTPIGRRILNVAPDDPGQQVVVPNVHLIGRAGVALTKMLPSGAIRIDDQTYDAVSIGAPIEVGQVIEVVRVDGTRIVVQATDRPADSPAAAEPSQAVTEADLLSGPAGDLLVDPFDDKLT